MPHPGDPASTTTRHESAALVPQHQRGIRAIRGSIGPRPGGQDEAALAKRNHRGLPRGAPSKWGAWWLGRADEACHQVGEDGHRPVGA